MCALSSGVVEDDYHPVDVLKQRIEKGRVSAPFHANSFGFVSCYQSVSLLRPGCVAVGNLSCAICPLHALVCSVATRFRQLSWCSTTLCAACMWQRVLICSALLAFSQSLLFPPARARRRVCSSSKTSGATCPRCASSICAKRFEFCFSSLFNSLSELRGPLPVFRCCVLRSFTVGALWFVRRPMDVALSKWAPLCAVDRRSARLRFSQSLLSWLLRTGGPAQGRDARGRRWRRRRRALRRKEEKGAQKGACLAAPISHTLLSCGRLACIRKLPLSWIGGSMLLRFPLFSRSCDSLRLCAHQGGNPAQNLRQTIEAEVRVVVCCPLLMPF